MARSHMQIADVASKPAKRFALFRADSFSASLEEKRKLDKTLSSVDTKVSTHEKELVSNYLS